MQITASLGMAAIHGNATTPYEVLAFADAACNAAKQRGGNAFVSYKDPAKQAEEQETQEDLRRINMLQQALKKNLFTLHFQPIAALAGKGEEIYEALLRLTNEEGEVTETPAEYLLAAERTGMIILIDRWVISRAMHILADKQRRGGNTNLCVKLSGSAYSDETLLPWLYERAQASKVEVSRLIFEIAEHDITAHINQVAAFSRALKKMRCRVMISHFGTQEAPFKLFKTVPVDIIKFHPQLTDAAGADPAAAAKLRNMVAAARQLNKPTIASQIESAAGMAALFQCGVDMAQGGFIHEPEAEMRFDFSGEM